MHRKFTWRALLKASLLAAGLIVGSQTATTHGQEKLPPMAKADQSGGVVVTIGGQSRLQMRTKKPIRRADNENDRIVQVLGDATDPTVILLIGRAAGTSRIDLTDSDGNRESYTVIVQRDMEMLRNLIRRTVPSASVEVTPIGDNGNSIILSGHVAREEDRDTIRQLAQALGLTVAVNTLSIGGGGNVPHVQLDMTLAKVDRTKARSRGANFIVNGTQVSGGSLLGGLTTNAAGAGAGALGGGAAGAAVGVIPSALQVGVSPTPNLVVGIIPSQFQLLLSALRTEGLAKLVTAPSVITRSGEQGEIFVGSRVPVVSSAAGITGPGVTYEQVGTNLIFTPIVYGNGKIHLTIRGQVQSISQANALATPNGTSPAFDEQRLNNSIIMESGQSFAIGGLIQTNVSGSVSKVPFLGDIPFLGALFSVSTAQEQETELVVIVTPHLVDAADPSQMPRRLPGSETRKPDDFEFFLETMLEAPRGPRQVFDGHHYRAAWKNDPVGAYPCASHGQGGGNCATPTTGYAPVNGSSVSGTPVMETPKVVPPPPSSPSNPNKPQTRRPPINLDPVPVKSETMENSRLIPPPSEKRPANPVGPMGIPALPAEPPFPINPSEPVPITPISAKSPAANVLPPLPSPK